MRLLTLALAALCGFSGVISPARGETLAGCLERCDKLWDKCGGKRYCNAVVKGCQRDCRAAWTINPGTSNKWTILPGKKLPPFEKGCPPGQFWSKAQGKCIGSAIDRRRSGMESGRHGRRHEGR